MIDISRFQKINLEVIANYYNFKLTNKATQNSPHMNNGQDIIIIKQHSNEEYTYWSPTAETKGDIFNFVMWQENCEFKTALDKIQFILGQEVVTSSPILYQKREKKEFDKSKIKQFTDIEHSKYLASRGLSRTIYHNRRFIDRIKSDNFNNVIFPHEDLENNIVGYTTKNFKFAGFSPGGTKTIWKSNQFTNDNRLVIGEAAIDILSYAYIEYLHIPALMFNTQYSSIDGGWDNSLTTLHIKTQIESISNIKEVTGIFDNDNQGREYSKKLSKICQELNVKYVENFPPMEKDWNDFWQKYIKQINKPLTLKG